MKTHQGSCHCGAVGYEADLDLQSASYCNCRSCLKLGIFGVMAKPEDLRVTRGEDQLTAWATNVGHRYFCKACGTHLFGRGDLKEWRGPFSAINVNTLDDIDPSTIPAGYW